MDQFNHASLGQTLKRTCDYHKARMRAAGFEDMAPADGKCTEEMGDITSIGEQYVTNQEQKSSAPLWVSAMGGAAAAGLISWLLLQDPDDKPTIPEKPPAKVGVGLEVERGGAIRPNGQNSGGSDR